MRRRAICWESPGDIESYRWLTHGEQIGERSDVIHFKAKVSSM